MLSVLIPTYNTVCVALIREIRNQASELHIPFEIIVADDASSAEFQKENEIINSFPDCTFIRLTDNIGPAVIRNLLADKARYSWLLFLDADTFPASGTFLKDYIAAMHPGNVICGGFTYERQNIPPDQALRYAYGTAVEEMPATDRNKNPHARFIGMSFMIEKAVFNEIRFDETMHFGYEDASFGIRMREAGIPVLHIDNPVYHRSLENSADYLKKMQRSLQNLFLHADKMKSDIRLLRWHKKIEDYKLESFVARSFRLVQKPVTRNLTGKKPSLKLFAFYKLGYYCLVSVNSKRADNASDI